MEYASKCLLHTNTNGVTRTSSPLSVDVPLDLTVSRAQEEKEPKPDPGKGGIRTIVISKVTISTPTTQD